MDKGENYGLVKAHAEVVHLFNVLPKVSEAGRERVRREKKKNVHAGLLGDVKAYSLHKDSIDHYYRYNVNNRNSSPVWREITYNPYKHNGFVFKDTGEDYKGSSEALMLDKKVFVR